MPRLGPVKRRDLIADLRRLGFEGPFPGKHQFMIRGKLWVSIPNPHRSDISIALLTSVLREAGISREEWEAL